ncbi:serine/threonine-protein kinase Nek2-like [Sinocyclocheilus rhinocerous]|uniref:serine/threonine-protein kinase Nek2-like n=1 Tax=Sinocyclocheilus rhinocerous TaxID=307959 RepID=UPI0007B7BD22|nr:PREDICTED: serine/threonine-protein kinase Nek2-like [Sinocyclocheilus rhinocerous]
MMPSRTEDYEVLLTIGCGSYGKCQKIKRKSDGKILVWKVLDYGTMAEAEKQMLVSEVNLLRELKHPNIVRYYDRIIDRTNTTLYIVMEYCEGGDLASLINRCIKDRRYLEEEFILRVMAQLSLALKECHGRSNGSSTVLHRDLKPANIFLDVKQNVKLGDFGLARILNHDTSFAKTFVGTPYYMSPEQINRMSYNEKSDIWSLGCLLYELCALSAESLLKAYNLIRQQRALSLLSASDTENEENISPGKKRVHFAGDGKENGRPESRLIAKPQEHCLVKRYQWANMRIQTLGEEEKMYSSKPREMQGIR